MRERIVEVELPEHERICPDTGQERHFIRWEESIKYDFVPGHFERVIIRRAVYALPQELREDTVLPQKPVITAPMPAAHQVIPASMASCGLLVYLLVSKYCDHLPLYRLQQIFKRRHQVEIDRSTMGHWMKSCATVLEALYDALRKELISSNYLQIDETFIKLLDPERRGKAVQSHFWVITKPGDGVLFWFDPGRGHQVAMELLDGYAGKLQSDGYSAYEAMQKKMPGLNLFHCWAHVRRKFVEAKEANGVDALWYIAEIQRLYQVEKHAREQGLSHEQREALRQGKSLPVLETIKKRLDIDKGRPEILPSSPLGKAMRYALERWEGLIGYAQEGNGEVEIDNNRVENAIRPTAIGKKNFLFIGHPNAGQTSAILYTIIENCRLQDVDPMEYLNDVLPRLQSHPKEGIAELLPRQWQKARTVAIERESSSSV